jgi:hypothetical protein
MTTKNKSVGSKLSKVSDSFTVNMYDNGYMLEISGRDSKDDWKTSKVMCASIDELFELIREVSTIERE